MTSCNCRVTSILGSVLFLSWSVLAPFDALASGVQFDLTADEVPTKATLFQIKNVNGQKILITGIPRLDRANNVTTYLALSPINPVAAPVAAATNKIFGEQKNRPLTWAESTAACQSYQAAGKPWKLVSAQELTQLSNFLRYEQVVLESDKPELQPLINNFHELRKAFPSQFSFFWVDFDEREIATGQKIAAVFKDKKLVMQPMSQQRLMNTICVTYFSGPDSLDVTAARANTDKKSSL